MEQRVSLISLFVDDLETAKDFYRAAFGWEPGDGGEGIAFYQLGGVALGLMTPAVWEHEHVDWPRQRAYVAVNLRTPAEVDGAIADAARAGASIVKEASPAPWGGYNGYVEDPWGNLWELAHNPFWTITDDGRTLLESPPD